MNLGDLLNELRVNILHDTSNLIAGASDQLWDTPTLTRYINEAYYRFAREAMCIRDGQSFTLKTVANQADYPLDPSVIAVISAKFDGDPADLARAGHSAFSTYSVPDPYFFDSSQLSTLPPGKPLAYGTDEYLAQDDTGSTSVVSLHLYPVPSTQYAGLQVDLRVVRGPMYPLINLTDIPEIPRAHHLEMLDWAAYLALRIVDHDLGDPGRAMEFRQSFEDAARKARNLALRKMFAPLNHGFGRNGWSWEGSNW